MSSLDITNLSIGSIPILASGVSKFNTLENVELSLLGNQLNVASTFAQELSKQLELSVNPNIGSNFDILI